MQAFYRTLSEKERRRYAAIEADKLGRGGMEYISQLFEIDPKTIRRGQEELNDGEVLSEARQRKKGADGKARSNDIPSQNAFFSRCCATIRRAVRKMRDFAGRICIPVKLHGVSLKQAFL